MLKVIDDYYGGYNPQWWDKAHLAREILHLFNEKGQGVDVLRTLLAKLGENPQIKPPFYCEDGKYTFIGDNFVAEPNVIFLDGDLIEVGSNVYCGSNVVFAASAHGIHPSNRNGIKTAPIHVGDGCVIGAGAVICKGVTVGSNVTVLPGAVVNRDVPDGAIVGGKPAKEVVSDEF